MAANIRIVAAGHGECAMPRGIKLACSPLTADAEAYVC